MDSETELAGLEPERGISRREFVTTMLAAGFAAAVRPIAAQTVVHTDSQGLTAGEVRIPIKDGYLPAYRAVPDHGTHHPVVLVVQEIFGVHEYIKDVCRRLAKAGCLAVAPELYARQGDVSRLAHIEEVREVVARVPDAQVLGDLDAAAEWAVGNGGDRDRLGITGFCWGGRMVWLYAAHNPRLKAAVAWYGRLSSDPDPRRPTNPVDVVKTLTVPVLGLYGGADPSIPIATVEKFQAALTAAQRKSRIVVYPDAPHGFHADYRPSYRKAAAEDGWQRMLAWFRENGVG